MAMAQSTVTVRATAGCELFASDATVIFVHALKTPGSMQARLDVSTASLPITVARETGSFRRG